MRNVDVDALQVMGASAANCDLVCHSECLRLRLRTKDFDNQQACADDDAAIGDVEVRPVVVDDGDFEEVDDVMKMDAVVEVADGSAKNKRKGNRSGAELNRRAPLACRAQSESQPLKKQFNPQRTAAGESESANMLKAAPVLSTCVMRKTCGITTCAAPSARFLATASLLMRSRTDHDERNQEEQRAIVTCAARLAVELVGRVLIVRGHQAWGSVPSLVYGG